MAYKINIRNTNNDGWVNLLEAQYLDVLDVNGKFAGSTVEDVLEELFDNKAQRTVKTADPTAADSTDGGYDVGTTWVNTTTDKVFVCVNSTPAAAQWLNISSIDVAGIEDVVGGVFTSNPEAGITAIYNTTTNKVELVVETATNTLKGIASFDALDFDVATGAVSIKDGAIAVNHLASNIDASGIGFNAALVMNRAINDTLTPTTNDIWTGSYVKDYVDSMAAGLVWQPPVISIGLDAPPVSPTAGDRYVVSAGIPPATGAWVGHDNEIATWDGAAWVYDTVLEGWAVWNNNLDTQEVYNGTTWAKIGTTVTHSNLVNLQGGFIDDLNTLPSEHYHITEDEHNALTGAKAPNTFFATPDGSTGVGGFRLMVADDVPDLAYTQITDFDEHAQDAVASMFDTDHGNITASYNDNLNTMTLFVETATAGVDALSSTKGLASFDSGQFIVDGSGFVSIIPAALTHAGLSDISDYTTDDHKQYVHISEARTITAKHTINVTGAPFVLGANAQGPTALVTGLNADLLNGRDWSVGTTAERNVAVSEVNDIWIEVTV